MNQNRLAFLAMLVGLFMVRTSVGMHQPPMAFLSSAALASPRLARNTTAIATASAMVNQASFTNCTMERVEPSPGTACQKCKDECEEADCKCWYYVCGDDQGDKQWCATEHRWSTPGTSCPNLCS